MTSIFRVSWHRLQWRVSLARDVQGNTGEDVFFSKLVLPKVLVLVQLCQLAFAGLQPLHGGHDRACRGISHSGAWEAGPNKAVEGWTADSLEQCKGICTGSCQAIQYVSARNICRVWNVPVLHSVSMPGSECYVKAASAASAASSGSGLAALKPELTHCLAAAKDGCSLLLNRFSCLSSKDPVSGDPDPCVWCGGSDCHGDSHARCTSFSKLGHATANTVSANAFEHVGALEVAHCIAASPAVDQTTALTSPHLSPSSAHSVATAVEQDSSSDEMLGSALPPHTSLRHDCMAPLFSQVLLMDLQEAARDASVRFVQFHVRKHGDALCLEVRHSDSDCLQPAISCGAIRDKLICLSSKDAAACCEIKLHRARFCSMPERTDASAPQTMACALAEKRLGRMLDMFTFAQLGSKKVFCTFRLAHGQGLRVVRREAMYEC